MKSESERARQHALHEAIARAIDDDDLLVGWVLVYETAPIEPDGRPACGHFYGPTEMTTWRALGLVEWARRQTLTPDAPEEDDA